MGWGETKRRTNGKVVHVLVFTIFSSGYFLNQNNPYNWLNSYYSVQKMSHSAHPPPFSHATSMDA